MLTKKLFHRFALIVAICRATGATPFFWDRHRHRLFRGKKARRKTRRWLFFQTIFLIYLVIRTVYVRKYRRSDLSSFNFWLSTVFTISIHLVAFIPFSVFDASFAQLVNTWIYFMEKYQRKFLCVKGRGFFFFNCESIYLKFLLIEF